MPRRFLLEEVYIKLKHSTSVELGQHITNKNKAIKASHHHKENKLNTTTAC